MKDAPERTPHPPCRAHGDAEPALHRKKKDPERARGTA